MNVDSPAESLYLKRVCFPRDGFPHAVESWITLDPKLILLPEDPPYLPHFHEGFLDTKAGKPCLHGENNIDDRFTGYCPVLCHVHRSSVIKSDLCPFGQWVTRGSYGKHACFSWINPQGFAGFPNAFLLRRLTKTHFSMFSTCPTTTTNYIYYYYRL